MRASGILLHFTSLPSPHGIGDLGPWARAFADLLSEAGQRYWQFLPLLPPSSGNSPYHPSSAFAGNVLLLSPEEMVKEGWLTQEEALPPPLPHGWVDYPSVFSHKLRVFQRAYEHFRERGAEGFEEFCARNSWWLEDYSLFTVLSLRLGNSWTDWPEGLRNRDPEALGKAGEELREEVEREKFLQYLFHLQWEGLRRYCRRRGVRLVGDLPFYLDHHSADVWAHRELFKLDRGGRPLFVSGVPPDYFSSTGQLWGQPVYDWKKMEEGGYEWWVRRMEHAQRMFDLVRVDHFRGFVAHWEVPAGERTAERGEWVEGPGEGLFREARRRLGFLSLIAEDLGTITEEVVELRERLGLPGMRVLQFAFGEDLPSNPHAPHNHRKDCVVYTGTHDNNTVRGWFEEEATPEVRRRFFRYVGREVRAEEVHLEFMRLALGSVAELAILPLQDVLGLGREARMNTPGRAEGNWRWRVEPWQLTAEAVERLAELTEFYGRGG
ncbi:MAG: 4-alpha-glucanotransferase [Candidatus Hadarchaeales archaeon]